MIIGFQIELVNTPAAANLLPTCYLAMMPISKWDDPISKSEEWGGVTFVMAS